MSAPRPEGLPPVAVHDLAHLAGTAVRGGDATVTGVTLRSADVRPGDLFLALAGSATHGAGYAPAAVQSGATAILTDEVGSGIIDTQADAAAIPRIVVPEPRTVIGAVAAAIYHHPSRAMPVIGVTGTSGKTTTSFLIEGALAAAGWKAGLIGTVGARLSGQSIPSALTTPEAPDLQGLLALMHQGGADAVTMEVSSHALALGRVDGVDYAVGAFTNLSQDHLDFHGDMEHYFAAKQLLFDGRAAAEVVVIDDDYGKRLAALHPGAATVTGTPGARADWTARATAGPLGTQDLVIQGPDGQEIAARIALPGTYNVTNALTALACAAAAGVDPGAAARGLASVQVPGRMQRIDHGQPFLALVDYAHKPAAVAAVLAAVRPSCPGRIIMAVGAGGDRDHGKRPIMGANAARGADIVIITDDNPRSEDPAEIRAAVLAGAREIGGDIREIGDRREAIRAAIAAAGPGDAVIIAGKGHEPGQEIAGVVHHFDDAEEVAAALADAGYGSEAGA